RLIFMVFLCFCHSGRELPPICSDVRQKQRLSIDTLPPEVKAPFPSDPVIPLRTKTTKEFQEDMERAVQSGDWREVREFYLTTLCFLFQASDKRRPESVLHSCSGETESSGDSAKTVLSYEKDTWTDYDTEQRSFLTSEMNI
ncbi:putative E3 ubiquitin-protein ligase HECTD2, partial [Nibea albiflora]